MTSSTNGPVTMTVETRTAVHRCRLQNIDKLLVPSGSETTVELILGIEKFLDGVYLSCSQCVSY